VTLTAPASPDGSGPAPDTGPHPGPESPSEREPGADAVSGAAGSTRASSSTGESSSDAASSMGAVWGSGAADSRGAGGAGGGVPALRLAGVRQAYGAHEVLRGIDVSIFAPEVVCLIGPSGSGKSTLLRCINLLERLTAGRIELWGQDVTAPRVDQNAVRRHIGIVFQAFNLFPHMSVLRNVTLAPMRVLGMPRLEAEHRARALLGRFDLADKEDAYPDRLSGGQQQRVAIVRALAMRPQIMLLDEITSALDPELVAEVLAVVRELAESGMTMLIATHEMHFARDIADRVCMLDSGVLVEEGPPEAIFGAPREERTKRFLARIVDAGRL
jgi:polar amino acid transport system ATP-binding protein